MVGQDHQDRYSALIITTFQHIIIACSNFVQMCDQMCRAPAFLDISGYFEGSILLQTSYSLQCSLLIPAVLAPWQAFY